MKTYQSKRQQNTAETTAAAAVSPKRNERSKKTVASPPKRPPPARTIHKRCFKFGGGRHRQLFYSEKRLGRSVIHLQFCERQEENVDLLKTTDPAIKSGQQIWRVLKKRGWSSVKDNKNPLGDYIFLSPGVKRKEALEGVTKYTGYETLARKYEEDGCDVERLIQRAEEAVMRRESENGEERETTNRADVKSRGSRAESVRFEPDANDLKNNDNNHVDSKSRGRALSVQFEPYNINDSKNYERETKCADSQIRGRALSVQFEPDAKPAPQSRASPHLRPSSQDHEMQYKTPTLVTKVSERETIEGNGGKASSSTYVPLSRNKAIRINLDKLFSSVE